MIHGVWEATSLVPASAVGQPNSSNVSQAPEKLFAEYRDCTEKLAVSVSRLDIDALEKMELQNMFYSYFAESARHFKRVRDSIRSSEAELQVVAEDEELPSLEAMRVAQLDFKTAVQGYSSFVHNRRAQLGNSLQSQSRPCLGEKAMAPTLFGAAVITAFIPGSPAAIPYILGVGGGATLAALPFLRSMCSTPKLEGVKKLWDRSGDLEERIEGMLTSKMASLDGASFADALEATTVMRSVFDDFLNLLQRDGLMFNAPIRAAA